MAENGLSFSQAVTKRTFDFSVASVGLLLLSPIILPAWLVASVDTRSNGFFTQQRVGKNGKCFKVVKIRTMRPDSAFTTTVTRSCDPRITRIGRAFRNAKIDELPQLWNVLIGQMSLVGPRPDVPGYADQLCGEARAVLCVRPGITSPATLKYRNEEEILANVEGDPETYNSEVIFPDKVRLNLEYIHNWSLMNDIRCIWQTIFGA